jgi:hypothetical protein
MTEPLFNSACKKRLNKAIEIVDQRGQQYGDTLRDCQWLIMRATIEDLFASCRIFGAGCLRALAIAGLCDIKYQRVQGGYKEDNIDDGINYLSILPEMIRLAKDESSQVSSREAEKSQES